MYHGDKKKIATVILSKLTPGGGAPREMSEDEQMVDQEIHSLAEDMISAMRSGDVKALADALMSFKEMLK